MKVFQLINKNGNPVANHFIITDGNKELFQSYSSIVAIVEKGSITLGRNWDYSRTTIKHLKAFLGISLSTQQIRDRIEAGTIHYDEDLI